MQIKSLDNQLNSPAPTSRRGRTRRNLRGSLCTVALAVLGWALPIVPATAQLDSPSPAGGAGGAGQGTSGAPGVPGAPGGAPHGGPPGGKMPAMPPLPVLLGIADFLIAVDRPFDAEKIYKLVLMMNPKSAVAQQGLHRAKIAESPSFTALIHTYRDTLENRLTTYGGGPTFRTIHGNITLLLGTGYFRETIHADKPNQTLGFLQDFINDRPLGKSTVNLILEPRFGKYEGYVFLNRTFYAGAPDRTLFNFKLTYDQVPGREHYSVGYMRNDSFIQSDQLQFFAPETFYSVESGLTEDIASIEIQHPIARKVDFQTTYQYLAYSDGNSRNLVRTQLLYRLQPNGRAQMPIFQVGLQHIYDDTNVFGVYYYTPQNQQYLDVCANYIFISRKFKYGLFGTYPVAHVRGSGDGKYDPLATLYAFTNYQISDRTELYVKLTTAKRTGNAAAFTDFVFGVNQHV